MSKSIFELKLHEELELDTYFYVTRVPGGWIYTDNKYDTTTSVFVPYSIEFYCQEVEKAEEGVPARG